MSGDPTVDPALGSWIPVPIGSDFPIQNLPYGVFRRKGEGARVGVAIGNRILDLDVVAEAGLLGDDLPWGVFAQDSLNPFMALGRPAWQAVRGRVSDLLSFDNRDIRSRWGLAERALVPQPEVEMLLPFEAGDYVDFYSSLEHATNLGKMFRPDSDPLLPNWRWLPVGYHGRSASLVVSGTPVVRPHGQIVAEQGAPRWEPTRALDFELEVGFVTGTGNPPGTRIPPADFVEHAFGMVLVNDWSARDIQRWEYVPLGPFLGKSFATSVSPWVVPLDAVAPYRVPAPPQDPPPLDYLVTTEDWGIDLHLEVGIASVAMAEREEEPYVVTRTNLRHMYWTMPQQLAHATVNGARARTGDLWASGTVSGPTPDSYGSMIELSWRGTQPIGFPDGTQRVYLADGDTVVMRGWCGGDGRPRIGFGEVTGTVWPAV